VTTRKTSSDPVSSREPIVAHYGFKVKGYGHKLTSSVTLLYAYRPTSHLCLFFIRETKCVTIQAGGEYRVGRTRQPYCLFYLLSWHGE